MSIVKGDYKMEKIALPQITRWLLFEMRPADANSVIDQNIHRFKIVHYKCKAYRYLLKFNCFNNTTDVFFIAIEIYVQILFQGIVDILECV